MYGYFEFFEDIAYFSIKIYLHEYFIKYQSI